MVVAAFTLWAILWISFVAPDLKAKYSVTPYSYAYTLLFIGFAVAMLWKHSRAAAVAAFTLYLLDRGLHWETIPLKYLLGVALIALGFLNGVRGCFAWHRLSPKGSDELVPGQTPPDTTA